MQPVPYANTCGDIILLQLTTALRSKWTCILFAVLAFLVIASIVTAGRKGLLEHMVTINSETVTEQASQDATVSRWSGIHRVIRTQNHVLIYLTPITAHVIPRRAIAVDWDDFYETLLAHWRSARA